MRKRLIVTDRINFNNKSSHCIYYSEINHATICLERVVGMRRNDRFIILGQIHKSILRKILE